MVEKKGFKVALLGPKGSYTFEAEYRGVVKSLQVNLVTDTPIIFDFSDT